MTSSGRASFDRPIEAIDRALQLLLLFYEEKRELGISEIAAILGMHKSTAYRTLATLQQRGFVEKNPSNQKYWLGIKTFTLGMVYSSKMELRTLARPFLEKLAERFSEAVHLAVLDLSQDGEPRVVVIDKIETRQILSTRIGFDFYVHSSGVGKVLMAYSTPDKVARLVKNQRLRRFTKNTITDVARFNEELAAIRENGYAIDREEMEIGLTCVAVPIRNHEGEVVAAVSLSGPTTRITEDRHPEIIEQVKEVAMAITERLG